MDLPACANLLDGEPPVAINGTWFAFDVFHVASSHRSILDSALVDCCNAAVNLSLALLLISSNFFACNCWKDFLSRLLLFWLMLVLSSDVPSNHHKQPSNPFPYTRLIQHLGEVNAPRLCPQYLLMVECLLTIWAFLAIDPSRSSVALDVVACSA